MDDQPRVTLPGRNFIRLLMVGVMIACVVPLRAQAQIPSPQAPPERWSAPVWAGHVTFVGANALIGGLSAGVIQLVHGGEFDKAFVRGLVGGGVTYVGRRVAVEHFDGAGIIGRQVSAVGLSVIRNAADGRGAFDRLILPLGPVRLYWDNESRKLWPKVSVYESIVFGVVAALPETAFDLSASLSAGAPVFRAPGRQLVEDGEVFNGLATGGTIILSGIGQRDLEETFAHERVHVLQQDFLSTAWSGPIESWLASQSSVTKRLYKYIDFDVAGPVLLQMMTLPGSLEYRDRPWELEANFLAER